MHKRGDSDRWKTPAIHFQVTTLGHAARGHNGGVIDRGLLSVCRSESVRKEGAVRLAKLHRTHHGQRSAPAALQDPSQKPMNHVHACAWPHDPRFDVLQPRPWLQPFSRRFAADAHMCDNTAGGLGCSVSRLGTAQAPWVRHHECFNMSRTCLQTWPCLLQVIGQPRRPASEAIMSAVCGANWVILIVGEGKENLQCNPISQVTRAYPVCLQISLDPLLHGEDGEGITSVLPIPNMQMM